MANKQIIDLAPGDGDLASNRNEGMKYWFNFSDGQDIGMFPEYFLQPRLIMEALVFAERIEPLAKGIFLYKERARFHLLIGNSAFSTNSEQSWLQCLSLPRSKLDIYVWHR